MRRFTLLLVVAVAASVLLIAPSIALGNFAIHGGYSMDTDVCAGCHRAHTAASSVTWANQAGDQRSALLISTATQLYQFCSTCHGAGATGAETNVEHGVYEGTEYGDLNQPLNSGTFGANFIGDNHVVTGGDWGAWGGGDTGRDGIISTGYGNQIYMTCGSCHDVHGSSNYRLLKDSVNGVTVGGYNNGVPQPYVISNETSYPQSGWYLQEVGASQMTTYQPNYTTPMYAKAPGEDASKGISAWCAACHTQYHLWEADPTTTTAGVMALNFSSEYDANDSFGDDVWGLTMRYRHPINVPLSNYDGARSLVITDQILPTAQSSYTETATLDDWIDCLTCHRAHGSDATMEGFATDQAPGWETDWGTEGPRIQYPGTKNAFLRLDNREVCQRCHDK